MTPKPNLPNDAIPEDLEKALHIAEDAEIGSRSPTGVMHWVIFGLAIGWSLFQLWIASFGVLDATRARAIHLCFAIVLTYLVFPFRKKTATNRIPVYDYLFALIAGLGVLYIVLDYTGIQQRAGIPILREVWFGSIFILLLLEATRRSLGPALAVIASIFLLYSLAGPRGALPFLTPLMPDLIAHRGYDVSRLISQMYVTTEGIFGVALGVSTQFVFLFVLFGSMLDKAGAGKYFIDVAYAFLGTFRGGPAKASIMASMLTGTVSGSSIANTVTTGTFTIPLMKRIGYPPHKAAATEVAASTNGQLMPPIMGAAAFIMAEFVGIPYFDIVRHAIVPALLSYIALFYVVHLEALKLGLQGVPRAELPSRWGTFIRGVHYLIPVFVLIWGLVIARFTPAYSAMIAIVVTAGMMLLQDPILAIYHKQPLAPAFKLGFTKFYKGLEAGARNMVGVGVATASAGIIVGVVNLTGLGLRLTEIIDTVSAVLASGVTHIIAPLIQIIIHDLGHFEGLTQIVFTLLITAAASLILGMGLPTTANYIVMATLTAPVIYELGHRPEVGMTFPLVAAHLFVFYFGILADDTPPVGLAAYAASAIARSEPIKTGVQGFIYDMRTAILPFMFIFNTNLILVDVHSWGHGLHIFASGVVGMFAFAAGTQGFVMIRTTWFERIILLATAFMLIQPNTLTDALGILFYALVYGIQWWRKRQLKP
ncbi:MAG: TRAP transporter permease [Gemmatimonadetes bacterium]|nr:MAG: TRAP transporter permease [Gemmatimonadota bacterium]